MVEFCELCVIFLSTPSARRATFNKVHKTNLKYISIHALCEEGDKFATHTSGQLVPFLSTPSARRATGAIYLWYTLPQYFYPRPLRGGRPSRHAEQHRQIRFLSTPSARRATRQRRIRGVHKTISIHALCEEGDRVAVGLYALVVEISIHALCEEGDSKNRDKISIFKQIIQHSARI